MLQFPPLEPDKGPFSATSTQVAVNVLPISNGWGPMPSPSELGDSLGGQCYGAWWYRSTTGSFGLIAATKTAIKRLQSDGTWTDISKVGGYTGPDTGDLWQAERYGTKVYFTNLNDPLQVFDVDTGTVLADATGSPPRAKFIECVGDFLFLAFLKVGADVFPQDWQHCKIDDPTNWTVTGNPGDSDRQQIADGDEIVAIMSNIGGARIIQRRCKRRLLFTPGNTYSFQMQDIDASRGAIAPLAVVPFGGESYAYLNETGFFVGDEHRPIGAERMDRTFFADVDLDKLGEVQGIADPSQKIVWFRYQDQNAAYKMIGWDWQLDRLCMSDTPAQLLVSAVSIGAVLDDLDSYGTLDDIDIPLDSRLFKGGRITFGAFTASNKLSLFAGPPAAATVETPTIELTPETGSFVEGAKLKSDATNYTIQVGSADLSEDTLTWSDPETRDSRTGMCGFLSEAKFHRFRVNIAAGSEWDYLHGVSPFFTEAGFG
ncbi:hypothetical protein CO731_04861 [Aminobacter sp. MSH1]|uniref:hypothetical protein n=1 Tax=Aminobacter sp. MSH1 TaxID=374606 RepID=UPI000D50540F|nr:hypothetical protein [Aminobacter sp. MSH1]AWC25366.1 hypothetical protein CO731_04861 [Aminobacter sp. MSH1]